MSNGSAFEYLSTSLITFKQIESFIGNLDTAISNSSGVSEFDFNFNSTSLPDVIKEIKKLSINS